MFTISFEDSTGNFTGIRHYANRVTFQSTLRTFRDLGWNVEAKGTLARVVR